MNKKVIIIIAGVLILAAGAYFLLVKKSPNSTLPSSNGADEETTIKASLTDLISKGMSQTCTYSSDNGDGILYISSSGKVRGDFEAVVSDKSVKTHTIIDGNTSYVWTEGETTGFKTTFNSTTASDTGANSDLTPQDTKPTTINDIDYKCKVWITDSSKFDLPEGVDFQSFDSMNIEKNFGE